MEARGKRAKGGWWETPRRWAGRMAGLAALVLCATLSSVPRRVLECGHASSASAKASPALFMAQPEFKPCWASPGLLDHPLEAGLLHAAVGSGGGRESGSNASGLLVYGDECKRCVTGKACSFYILLVGSAHWGKPRIQDGWKDRSRSSKDPFRWELMATLRGPALAHATIMALTPDARFLRAEFRTWDPGMYRVTLYSSCGILRLGRNHSRNPHTPWGWSRAESYPQSDVVGTWQLQVDSSAGHSMEAGSREARVRWREAASAISWALGEPQLALQAQGPMRLLGTTYGPSPCLDSLHGRWLLRDGEYRWTPYDCAPQTPRAQEAVPLLVARGIREISFVGDSHMRVLAMHLYHVLVAGENNPWQPSIQEKDMGLYRNFSLLVPCHPHGGAQHRRQQYQWPQHHCQGLRINYFWADFMSQTGSYGCARPAGEARHGMFAGADLPRAADVTIVNAGTWTGHYCQESELAISGDLINALTWAAAQAKRRVGGQLVLRSASTRYTHGYNCYATNGFLHLANTMGQLLVRRFGAHYFNSWEVEAPRFVDVCPSFDHHYSCQVRMPLRMTAMNGDVGEAVVQALIHFLVQLRR